MRVMSLSSVTVAMLSPVHNLGAFLANKPPLVIFVACLATFATGFLFVANYVLTVPIKDPDALDWNDIMERLVQSKLCVSDVHFGPPGPNSERFFETKTRKEIQSIGDADDSTSVSMTFDLRFEDRVRRLAKGTEILWGNMDVNDLGLPKPVGVNNDDDTTIRVSFDFGVTHGLVNCTSSGFCSIDPYVCVTFQSPVKALPRMRDTSRKCVRRHPSINYDVSFRVISPDDTESCDGRTIIGLQYEPDASLTFHLDRNEQLLMNRHLTYTSYFLFVMIITVLGFAAFRSHLPSRSNCGSSEALLTADNKMTNI